MFASILAAITAFFKAIPIFSKWFTKTATQKVEEGKEDVRKEMDDFRDSGRPQA